MHTFDYGGQPIRYVREGEGEPLVFLHNGGTSHTIWRDVVPHFKGRFEVFAPDLPGFGASAKPSGYLLDDYVRALEAFVDHLDLGPVRLVGNCMGSAMALRFAVRRPSQARALVLINPLTDATFSAGWIGPALWLRKKSPKASSVLSGVLEGVRLPHVLSEQTLAFQFGAVGRKKKLHLTPELCACFTSEGQMPSLMGVFDDLVAYGALDELRPGPGFPPICTIWGVENRVLSAKAGRKLNLTLRPAREEWIEGCGHLVMMEKPDVVSAIIDEFFSTPQAAVA